MPVYGRHERKGVCLIPSVLGMSNNLKPLETNTRIHSETHSALVHMLACRHTQAMHLYTCLHADIPPRK